MQVVPITLAVRLAEGSLVLTATTPAKGESCDDSWSVSPSLPLVCEGKGEQAEAGRSKVCISRASVAASALAPDTTYTFAYAIVMRTGERTWAGSASATVGVGPNGALSFP